MDQLVGKERPKSYYLQERIRQGLPPVTFDLEEELHEIGKKFDEWFRKQLPSGELTYENIDNIVKRFERSHE